MHFLRSITGLLFLILAVLAFAAAGYQVRSEFRAVVHSWPNVDTPPEVDSGEPSPSDRDVSLPSPLAALFEALTARIGWLIAAGVFMANAVLLGMVNVLDRG